MPFELIKRNVSAEELQQNIDELITRDNSYDLRIHPCSDKQLATILHNLIDKGLEKQIVHLGLNENQLTNLPNDFGNLTALTYLYLHNNQLTNLPNGFGNLTALTYLYLHNNQLTNLPNGFGNLTALTTLALHNNQLTNLPNDFADLTALTYLYLNHNQLTYLPNGFGKLTKLTGLDLSDNQLTNLPINALKWNVDRIINDLAIAPLRQQLQMETERFADIIQGLFDAYCYHQQCINWAEENHKEKEDIDKMRQDAKSFYDVFFQSPLLITIIKYALIEDAPRNPLLITIIKYANAGDVPWNKTPQLTASPYQFFELFKELKDQMFDEDDLPAEGNQDENFVRTCLELDAKCSVNQTPINLTQALVLITSAIVLYASARAEARGDISTSLHLSMCIIHIIILVCQFHCPDNAQAEHENHLAPI